MRLVLVAGLQRRLQPPLPADRLRPVGRGRDERRLLLQRAGAGALRCHPGRAGPGQVPGGAERDPADHLPRRPVRPSTTCSASGRRCCATTSRASSSTRSTSARSTSTRCRGRILRSRRRESVSRRVGRRRQDGKDECAPLASSRTASEPVHGQPAMAPASRSLCSTSQNLRNLRPAWSVGRTARPDAGRHLVADSRLPARGRTILCLARRRVAKRATTRSLVPVQTGDRGRSSRQTGSLQKCRQCHAGGGNQHAEPEQEQ